MSRSRLSPIAAPTNSARSVAIAIASACSQRPMLTRRGKRSRHLGQVLAGGDAELGAHRLDEHRHQVRGDHDPEQQVAVPRAGRHVGREVAGVDVGDGGDEGRAEERPDAAQPPPAPGQRLLRGREHAPRREDVVERMLRSRAVVLARARHVSQPLLGASHAATVRRASRGGGIRPEGLTPLFAYGLMFWFRWNRLSGSYRRLTCTSRS